MDISHKVFICKIRNTNNKNIKKEIGALFLGKTSIGNLLTLYYEPFRDPPSVINLYDYKMIELQVKDAQL